MKNPNQIQNNDSNQLRKPAKGRTAKREPQSIPSREEMGRPTRNTSRLGAEKKGAGSKTSRQAAPLAFTRKNPEVAIPAQLIALAEKCGMLPEVLALRILEREAKRDIQTVVIRVA